MIVTTEKKFALTTSFSSRLDDAAAAKHSLLCVGLDPRENSALSARETCLRLIDQTAEFAVAFKVNSAFFEVFGGEGFSALREVIEYVPPDTPVILDAKRGDIADTAEAYARAAFDLLHADAITMSPYLGGDTLAPFLDRPERGVFVLCKTSNPGADEFQALRVGDSALYELVAQRAQEWNRNDNLGLVVGATDPAALRRVRAIAPDLWLLVPGVGAQGADLEATLAAGLRADGAGILIAVSRSLAGTSNPRSAAQHLRDEINRAAEAMNRHELKPRTSPAPARAKESYARSDLASDLLSSGCVRFGEFTLKSGALSPIYLDLRQLVSHPTVLRRVARAYSQILGGLHFDRLSGIPYAGLPIATAIALDMDKPMVYVRREAKTYGTGVDIEGAYRPGETIALIDDLATTGGTKIESIQKLEAAGLVVHDIVVLIDREQGARESLSEAGYRMHAVVTLTELLNEWQKSGAISDEQLKSVRRFMGA